MDEHLHEMLPQERTFINLKDLKQYLYDFAFSRGYSLSVSDSKTNMYCILSCRKGGKSRNRYGLNEETRKRNKGSIKGDECPLELNVFSKIVCGL